MAKKGQIFSSYTPEFKSEAVRLYEEEKYAYRTVAKILGIKSKTQIIDWVKRARNNKSLDDLRGTGNATDWRKGRPKTKFTSVEEELTYVKAERDYLKKRYPNLHEEVYPKKKGSK